MYRTSKLLRPRSRRDVMPSGQRLEHAQYVISLKIYFRSRFTAVASRILKSLLIDVAGYIKSPTPAAQDIRVLVDSHVMLMSKHVNSVCKSAFFSVRNVGRIGKYLDRDKCFLLYLPVKLKLSFKGTDRSLPGPLDFGMHYR